MAVLHGPCALEYFLSHTVLLKPLHFANCKVKTTVRESAFFISRILAIRDLEAKMPQTPLKKEKIKEHLAMMGGHSRLYKVE